MIINYQAEMAYARIIANDSGLQFNVVQGLTTPNTDFKSINVPPMEVTWEEGGEEHLMWWFYVIHECFHNRHKDDYALMKEKKVNMQSFLGTVLNIVVDYKIETRNRGEYEGRDKIVHKARYKFAADKIYGKMGATSDAGGRSDKLQAIWVFDALCRIPWIPQYANDDLERLLSPEGLNYVHQLLQSPTLMDKYADQETAQDSYDVVLDILNILSEDVSEPEEDEEEEQEGEGEGDDDGGEGEGESAEGEAGAKEAWVEFKNMMMDDHSTTDGIKAALHIKYEESDLLYEHGWVPLPLVVADLDTTSTNINSKVASGIQKCTLSKRIRKELQVYSKGKWQGQKKRGKLHTKALPRAVSGSSTNVFKKKVHRISTKNVSTMVLTDFSGSMCGDKLVNACVATHALAEVLEALRIEVGLFGFTTQSHHKDILLPLKQFNEKLDTNKFMVRCEVAEGHMSNNADGDFILWAHKTLLQRKADRRILFVLSDGSPAGADEYGNRGRKLSSFTKKVISEMENAGIIEVYAIGLEDDNVLDFYKHSAVINNASELEDKLLTVLRNKIIHNN